MLDKISSLRGIETNPVTTFPSSVIVKLDKISSLRGIETNTTSEPIRLTDEKVR